MSKITFRPLTEKDLEDRVRWLKDKKIIQYLGNVSHETSTQKKQEDWFKRNKKLCNNKFFVIEADGKPVGNIALTDISPINMNGGLFIIIGEKDYQRKGIGTEATNFITDFAFKELGLHQVWLYVCEENMPAIKLYEKCGFEKEGLLRDMWKIKGKYYGEIVMVKFNPKD